jgi:2-dehydro-3-deoxygalactonokinase
MTAIAPDWIAVDWGTSALRVWAMDSAGEVMSHRRSPDGMGGLAPTDFEAALLRLVADWIPEGKIADVVACGMVGAQQGWIEVPYRALPCSPRPDPPFALASSVDPRLRVHVLSGLSQVSPPDVMRGEETQIAGLLVRRPKFDGVVCLPGTHSKWVHVSAGEAISFTTFMTGELFELLSTRSVLRHALEADGWSADAFDNAIEESMARPERIASALFGIRARALLKGLKPGDARARLSGLLIGLELAGARAWWLGREVVLLGAPELAETYAAALLHCGLSPEILDDTNLTLDGLRAAHQALAAQGTLL